LGEVKLFALLPPRNIRRSRKKKRMDERKQTQAMPSQAIAKNYFIIFYLFSRLDDYKEETRKRSYQQLVWQNEPE
jgi:hypothetical protein